MRNFSVITLCLVLLSSFALATEAKAEANKNTETSISEEMRYDQFVEQLSQSQIVKTKEFSQKDQKLIVDALWDLITIDNSDVAKTQLKKLSSSHFALTQRVRLERLLSWPRTASLSKKLEDEILRKHWQGQLEDTTLTWLRSYSDHLDLSERLKEVVFAGDTKQSLARPVFRNKTKEEIKDLFYNAPGLEDFKDGTYADGIRLFMFCRKDRIYPCIMLMKDKNNQPVFKKDSNELWHHPALGMSKHRIPYYQRNGDTPAGVHTMDSVMPEANKPAAFGQFRRVILNFVSPSEGESELQKTLPPSAQATDWWKASVVARDVGRNLLRIHGTGRLPPNRHAPNYPLRPTLGCIMQREGKVGRVTYTDQRKILDTLMTNLDLPTEYENETKIKGVLYLIELNDRRKNVSYSDIMWYLQ